MYIANDEMRDNRIEREDDNKEHSPPAAHCSITTPVSSLVSLYTVSLLRLASSPNRRHHRAAHQASRQRRPCLNDNVPPPSIAHRISSHRRHTDDSDRATPHLIGHAPSPSPRGHHPSITTHVETDDHRPPPRRRQHVIHEHRQAWNDHPRGSHIVKQETPPPPPQDERPAPRDEQNLPPPQKSRNALPDER